MRLFTVLTIIISLSFVSAAQSQAQSQLNLMPMPASVQQGSGQLAITQAFAVSVSGTHDASLDNGVRRFTAQLSRQTGIPFRPKQGAATLDVHVDHGRDAIQKLEEDESYELSVAASGAKRIPFDWAINSCTNSSLLIAEALSTNG